VLRAGEYVIALEILRLVLQASPGDARLWVMQGAAWAGEGETRRALASYRSALKFAPDQADILLQNGAEPGTPSFRKAMRSAQNSVKLGPELGPAHAVLAKLYLQSGDYQQAVTECHKALEIDPADQTLVYHLI
jgi:Flp pilus assembly protein TadD